MCLVRRLAILIWSSPQQPRHHPPPPVRSLPPLVHVLHVIPMWAGGIYQEINLLLIQALRKHFRKTKVDSFTSYESSPSGGKVKLDLWKKFLDMILKVSFQAIFCALSCESDQRCYSFRHDGDLCYFGGVVKDLNYSLGTVHIFELHCF